MIDNSNEFEIALWPVDSSYVGGVPEQGRTWRDIRLEGLSRLFGSLLSNLQEGQKTIRVSIRFYEQGGVIFSDVEVLSSGRELLAIYAHESIHFSAYADTVLDVYKTQGTECPDLQLVISKSGYFWEDFPRPFYL